MKPTSLDEILKAYARPFVRTFGTEAPIATQVELSHEQAKEQLKSLFEEQVIGRREDEGKFKDLSSYKQRKILIEYELRAEQRERLEKL